MPRSSLATVLRRYPLRLQSEEADCGPACLEMVAAYHGARHALATLKEMTHVQAFGTSLLDLATAAQQLGFEARGVHVEEPGELEDEEGRAMLPAIAHWNEDHFVVLYEVTPKEAVVGDPAVGLLRVPREKLGQHWNGILLLLEPTEALFKPGQLPGAPATRRPHVLGRFLRGLWRYRALIAQIALASLLLQSLALAQPLLFRGLVDKAVGGKDVSLLGAIGVGLGVLMLAQVAVTLVRGATLFLLSSGYSMLLLTQFWKRLLSLPISFFARRHRGDLLRRLEDHQRIRRTLQGATASAMLDAVMLVGYGVVLFLYDPIVFAIFLAGMTLYAGWTTLVLMRRTRADTERFRVSADSSRLEMQMIGGIQTLKACGAERQARTQWERLQARDHAATRRLWGLDLAHQAGAQLLNQAMYVGILLYEARLVISGSLTMGQMVATLAILGLVLAPLQNLIAFAQHLQDVLVSLRRVGVVYETEPELTDDAPVEPALKAAPEIALEGVTFRYGSPHEPPVLDDVSFTVPAGKMTAIVGRSGAGKTTLTQVLYGLYRPQAGRVLYDGKPLEDFNPASLRRSVGFVFQKTDIFDGSLAENIALGDPSPDRERLLYAARTACLDDLLALPRGLDTRIGEAGIKLSGGEEQRLQLARAIYRDPRVLFLDEATSHLDATLERAITEALRREAQGRTLVVVAHRLSTVRRADKIVVLEKGRVVEEGTHEQLVALPGGRYRALVENQMEG
ncbi:peptidase domain-containing ABC transporter [Archangium violaceum]|uniref:peptidase domain-containing ABC transporter n=1 Tax=Archangium violaceum TaxID=83451 RepID=UPI00194F470F|nr:peptidase domain-containing ABC transporter [Archangium violaceum]QRN95159.1 peptidase domain-containing ABC transporter [Archangium violaceum]